MDQPLNRRAFLTSTGCLLALSGCAEDGWMNRTFNPPEADTLEPEEGYIPIQQDTRQVILEVTEVQVEPTIGGVIVHATGIAKDEGFWDAELVHVNPSTPGSAFELEFRVRPPVTLRGTTGTTARTIRVARTISTSDLGDARQIDVIAFQNRRSIRPR